MKGRKANPAAQAAKAYPGKRKSKIQRAAEDEAARAKELAEMVATSGDPINPPVVLASREPAIIVWRALAPGLSRMNLLQDADRFIFAMFCISYATWHKAITQLQIEGEVVRVKTVVGGYMPRMNPWTRVETDAYNKCMALSEQFGLTPMHRTKLFRERNAAGGGLFADPRPPTRDTADTPAPSPASSSPVGMMDGLDSDPPMMN